MSDNFFDSENELDKDFGADFSLDATTEDDRPRFDAGEFRPLQSEDGNEYPEGPISNGNRLRGAIDTARTIGRVAKNTGKVAMVGLGIAGLAWGVNEGKRLWEAFEDFPPDLSGIDSTEVKITKPTTRVMHDIGITLEDVETEFGVKLNLNQDRTLLFDCNLEFDETVQARNSVDLDLEQVTLTEDKDSIDIEIEGDLEVARTSTDWQNTGELNISTLSFCGENNANRIQTAYNGIVEGTGGLATACALNTQAGVDHIKSGVTSMFTNYGILGDTADKTVSVSIAGLEHKVGDIYDQASDSFYEILDKVEEIAAPGDNDDFEVNSREITDCSKHKITFVEPDSE